MNSDTLIFIWILAFPIGIIQVSTPRKWSYLLYFSSLHYYWTSTTLVSLEHNSLCEMEWCDKRAFQLLKMWKKKVSWNIKTKCVTDFILTVRSSSMNDYTCHYVVSTYKTKFYINFKNINENFEIIFTRNRVFKHKGIVSNLHVCCNGLGKLWASYIFQFLLRILTYIHMKKFNIFLHNICRDVQHSLFRSR